MIAVIGICYKNYYTQCSNGRIRRNADICPFFFFFFCAGDNTVIYFENELDVMGRGLSIIEQWLVELLSICSQLKSSWFGGLVFSFLADIASVIGTFPPLSDYNLQSAGVSDKLILVWQETLSSATLSPCWEVFSESCATAGCRRFGTPSLTYFHSDI